MWAVGADETVKVVNTPANPVPVTVTNTLANPVPVTGSTTVSGTVNAVIQGTPEVTVGNPIGAPALTSSVDDPGRVPYQSTQARITPTNFCADTDKTVCFMQFPAVPAGHRLVVQNISGSMTLSAAAKSIRFTVGFSVPATGPRATVSFLPPSAVDGQSMFTQPVLLFFDAGQIPVASIFVNGASFDDTQHSVTLTGYMLDCTVNLCAPIAN